MIQPQATSIPHACVLRSNTEKGYQTCHTTAEYTEQMDESLSGVKRCQDSHQPHEATKLYNGNYIYKR